MHQKGSPRLSIAYRVPFTRLRSRFHGLFGWGETCPVGPTYQPHHSKGAAAALEEMAQGVDRLESSPSCLAPTKMDGLLNGHRYAKAAVDIAA
jgi:L-alanine-DL-glutamate epimerase-like enolase superfamily enzyme